MAIESLQSNQQFTDDNDSIAQLDQLLYIFSQKKDLEYYIDKEANQKVLIIIIHLIFQRNPYSR